MIRCIFSERRTQHEKALQVSAVGGSVRPFGTSPFGRVRFPTAAQPDSPRQAAASQEVQLEVPYLSQEDILPTGCEAVSAAMVLQYWEVDVTPEEVASMLPCAPLYQLGGQLYGPNPDEFFVGSPFEETGYGCYAPVIAGVLEEQLSPKYTVTLEYGCTIRQLYQNYVVEQGAPVLIWVTIDLVEPTPAPNGSWKTAASLPGRRTNTAWCSPAGKGIVTSARTPTKATARYLCRKICSSCGLNRWAARPWRWCSHRILLLTLTTSSPASHSPFDCGNFLPPMVPQCCTMRQAFGLSVLPLTVPQRCTMRQAFGLSDSPLCAQPQGRNFA